MTEFTMEAADRFRRAVGDLVRAVRLDEDAPAGQIETLGFLFRDGAHSIAELARRRRVRHQSMSGTIAELEAHGLVSRSPDPHDGRGVLVTITDSGADTVRESRLRRSTVIKAAAERSLTPYELATLAGAVEIFNKLRDALIEG